MCRRALRLLNGLIGGLLLVVWIIVLYYSVVALAVRRWPHWVTTASEESGWFLLAAAFLVGALLSSSLLLFDLLTLVTAAFTLKLGVKMYTLIRMLDAVGASGFRILVFAWSAVFAWALFAGFRPLWERAGKRLADLFD